MSMVARSVSPNGRIKAAEETEQNRLRKGERKDQKGKSEIESVYYLLTSANTALMMCATTARSSDEKN